MMEIQHQWVKEEQLILSTLGLCKAFGTVLHGILAAKMKENGSDGWTTC